MLCIYTVQYGSQEPHVAVEPHWNMADAAEELNFKLYFILINLNVNDVASGYHVEWHG